MQQKECASPSQVAERMAGECVGLGLDRLHRVVTRRYEHELRPLGLTLQQLQMLTALVLTDDAWAPAQLADYFRIERSTVSRNLALLAGRGYVEAVGRTATGRLATVVVSEDGRGALTAAGAAWSRAQAALIDVLGDDARSRLDDLLAAADRLEPETRARRRRRPTATGAAEVIVPADAAAEE